MESSSYAHSLQVFSYRHSSNIVYFFCYLSFSLCCFFKSLYSSMFLRWSFRIILTFIFWWRHVESRLRKFKHWFIALLSNLLLRCRSFSFYFSLFCVLWTLILFTFITNDFLCLPFLLWSNRHSWQSSHMLFKLSNWRTWTFFIFVIWFIRAFMLGLIIFCFCDCDHWRSPHCCALLRNYWYLSIWKSLLIK